MTPLLSDGELETGAEKEIIDTTKEIIKPPMTVEDIRTDATKAMLATAKEVLDKWESEVRGIIEHSTQLGEALTEVRRAFREFNASLFFVVAFGPVKAGKSTFVNILARQYVSPTQWGVECTLRPSIIVKHREAGIDEYFVVPGSEVDEQQAFQVVIDHLRGLSDEKEIGRYVTKETALLTPDSVVAKLARSLKNDPLITVIRVPGGEFIREGIALLDMPGLDGEEAGWEKVPAHQWVMSRSDFLIYIQSSIAALNFPTKSFLRDVIAARNLPIWSIQNIIDARHWRSREERDDDAQKQKTNAEARLRDHIGSLHKVQTYALNLGKAEDGIFRSNENLFHESNFEDLEKRLTRALAKYKIAIQERNSVVGMPSALKKAAEILLTFRNDLLAKRNAYERNLDELDKLIERVKSLNYTTSGYLKLKSDISTEVQQQISKWIDDIQKAISSFRSTYTGNTLSGTFLNTQFLEIGRGMVENGQQYIFNNNDKFGSKITELASTTALQTEQALSAEVNEKLKALNLRDLPVRSGLPASLVPTFWNQEFNITDAFLPKTIFLLVQRKHNAEKWTKSLDLLEKTLESQIKRRVQHWTNEFENTYSGPFCMKRREFMVDHVAQAKNEYQDRMKDAMDAENRTIEKIREMLKDIEKLDSKAKTAVQSLINIPERNDL